MTEYDIAHSYVKNRCRMNLTIVITDKKDGNRNSDRFSVGNPVDKKNTIGNMSLHKIDLIARNNHIISKLKFQHASHGVPSRNN